MSHMYDIAAISFTLRSGPSEHGSSSLLFHAEQWSNRGMKEEEEEEEKEGEEGRKELVVAFKWCGGGDGGEPQLKTGLCVLVLDLRTSSSLLNVNDILNGVEIMKDDQVPSVTHSCQIQEEDTETKTSRKVQGWGHLYVFMEVVLMVECLEVTLNEYRKLFCPRYATTILFPYLGDIVKYQSEMFLDIMRTWRNKVQWKEHLYGPGCSHLSWKQRIEISNLCSKRNSLPAYRFCSRALSIVTVKSTNILLDEIYASKGADSRSSTIMAPVWMLHSCKYWCTKEVLDILIQCTYEDSSLLTNQMFIHLEWCFWKFFSARLCRLIPYLLRSRLWCRLVPSIGSMYYGIWSSALSFKNRSLNPSEKPREDSKCECTGAPIT
ncbi:hypothetical protein NC652_010440 [Populus alba x Populus x berolinensis]|nr:hypothetical protein NC652_010440 [Populus alba x Populus x berolinensis]